MATYNYTVTASGNSYYLWNGHGLVDAQNPDLFFRAGDSVTITNASGGHPMRITNDAAPSVGPIDESNGAIVVDPVSEGTFTYFCTSHPSAMRGAITISAAYANEGPEDGYGTGPLIGHDAGPLSMNEIRTKINEIITKGGVGGTTGGASVKVSELAPTNPAPSDGDLWWDPETASLYIYFADRNAWIQTNGAVGGGANFSTGWVNTDKNGVQIAVNTRLDFDHNLGTTDIIVKVYQANDINGTDARDVSDYYYNANNEYGARVYNITDSSLSVEFGAAGDYNLNLAAVGTDSTTSLDNNYIKVVASAGGGGASGGGDASIKVSDTAPTPAENGDLWFNTTQAELYVYVDAQSAWIQTNGGGGSGGGNFSTGWVNTDGTTAVANLARLTFNHNLGTTDLNFSVYAADDSAGTNSCQIPPHDVLNGGFYGAQIEDLTNSSFVLQFSKTGFIKSRSNSSSPTPTFNWSGKYIKVVASAGGGGAGPRAYVEFAGTASNMTDELNASNSFNVSSITDNGAGNYTVAFTSPVNNPIISVAFETETYPTGVSGRPNESYEILNNDQVRIKIFNRIASGSVYNYDAPHISLIVF